MVKYSRKQYYGYAVTIQEDFSMIFKTVAELIAERTDCDVSVVTPESKFSDLGIDSLDTVELLMNLEDKLGKEIQLESKVETVGELVAFIETL